MEAHENKAVIDALNQILELELAGVVRYTHYSFMVFGFNRIPIVQWLRSQAGESLEHAHKVGELITQFGGHPSLSIGALLETHKHDVANILQESLEHEKSAVAYYRKLLSLTKDKTILLEEFALDMIVAEELHSGEVDKMLRNPGEIAAVIDTAA